MTIQDWGIENRESRAGIGVDEKCAECPCVPRGRYPGLLDAVLPGLDVVLSCLGGGIGVSWKRTDGEWRVGNTETYRIGSVLGKLPIQKSGDKSHKTRVFGSIIVSPTPSE